MDGFFKDKQRQDFNPYTYFDAKAIERRQRTGIPVDDPTDWPVNENYVNQVTSLVDEVIITSRWLNAVAVEASDAQLRQLNCFPYVLSVEWIEPSEMPVAAYNDYDTTLDAGEDAGAGRTAPEPGSKRLAKGDYNGKDCVLLILDVGFDRADQVPAFDHTKRKTPYRHPRFYQP